MLTISYAYPRDYIVYSIVQSVPMGHKNEVVKKNYYLNMGNNQGIQKGTVIDVFRSLSRVDPYASKKRYNYNIKVGELKILHSEEQSSIAKLNKLLIQEDVPLFDIDGIMIGDKVKASVK